MSGKDLYLQMIDVSSDDTFHARFPNIFVDYPLGPIRIGDKLWMNWNKAPLRLWQTQLNFATWCTSSACGVSSEHLNYAKHPVGKVAISISCVLPCEASSQKITGSATSRS